MITRSASRWPRPEPQPESEMGHLPAARWEKHIEVLLSALLLITIRVDSKVKLNTVSKFNVEKVKLPCLLHDPDGRELQLLDKLYVINLKFKRHSCTCARAHAHI